MKKVFLIEPDHQLANSISRLLICEGYRVLNFYDAESAITAMEEQSPEAMIVNIDLPNHTGLELLYEVSGYDDWGDVQIILTSSHILEADALGSQLSKQFAGRIFYFHRSSLSELTKLLKSAISIPK